MRQRRGLEENHQPKGTHDEREPSDRKVRNSQNLSLGGLRVDVARVHVEGDNRTDGNLLRTRRAGHSHLQSREGQLINRW